MLTEKLHAALTDDAVETDRGEARRFVRHLVSLMSTKIADGLIDPKLVLAWLMSAGGAPGYLIGALVPVREAGALLPQIMLARVIQRQSIRKYIWAAGAFLQGAAALGIAAAAVMLDGPALGWTIVACLSVLSLARAACSASYKDILARTVETGARGTVSGAAGTVAASVVFAFAALLAFQIIPLTIGAISVAIAIAGALWIIASLVFAGLDEPADERGEDTLGSLADIIKPLRTDHELRVYILARGLLTATALAPPFLVILAGTDGTGGLGNLGLLMLASSLAAIASSYIWGRLSDTSSRATMMFSGLLAGAALGAAATIGLITGRLEAVWLAPALLFVAQIGYEGVRAARKTHLTDMNTGGQKALYTALSNTLIGVLLLAGGIFGVIANAFGPAVVLGIFAGMSVVGALTASRLSNVQKDA
ncbi:MFS transporter [Tateyamaria armeniaca]|uniref:MFS transporter n=1 Tax=Tateyamaria armeniaca TaxID=2518930 RepID=A0ABW8UT37_9RHOB